MLEKIQNIPIRYHVNKTLKIITSPEVILTFGIIGAIVKICHDIEAFRKEHRRPIGFRK